MDLAGRRVEQARRNQAEARSRLDAAPRRWRRRIRADVELAEAQLERTGSCLERTRQRTASSLAGYRRAVAERDHAVDELRRVETVIVLHTRNDFVNSRRRHVDALDTWRTWASGGDVTVNRLADTVQILTARGSDGPEGLLARSIELWADSQQVELAGLQLATIPRRRGIGIER